MNALPHRTPTRSPARRAALLAVAVGLLSFGCAQPGDDDPGDVGRDLAEGDASPDVPEETGDEGMADVPPDRPPTDVTPDGIDPSTVLIYAHSRDTLYTFSPFTLTVREVGVFRFADTSAAPNMLDLAVNEAGEVYTSSYTQLFRVDPATAQVTLVGEFDLGEEQLFALTFLPAGVYRTDRETLIGATNAGTYYEVNPATARASFLGQYPDGWLSSGDIVSVVGVGTFATVKRSDATVDQLVEITFRADGSSTARLVGPIENETEQFRQIFGVGFWGRSLYGFTNSGQLIEIDRRSGVAEVVSTTTGADQFWGAGVTTVAPVLI